MRKRIVYLMVGVMLSGSILVGCGKETTKDKATTSSTIEVSSKGTETGTLETTDNVTFESETTEQSTTTVKQEETTTKKQEVTTTKKQETTTAKQEVTTTKKQETTTAKQEVTTTKKQETTTAKQEVTTTKKEEETTTQAPVVAGSWFEQKGYTITSKAEATKQAINIASNHECAVKFSSYIDSDEYYTSYGCDLKGLGVEGVLQCDYQHERFQIIAFDRYTGIAYWFNSEDNIAEFDVKGEKISFECSKTLGGSGYFTEVICPIEYDGVVFLVAKNEDLIYKGDGLVKGVKMYTIDEVYDFDVDDVFFLSVDDK